MHAGAGLFRYEKVASSRPSVRLGASAEITKRSGACTRDAESFAPFGHFLVEKSLCGQQKMLEKDQYGRFIPPNPRHFTSQNDGFPDGGGWA